MIKKLSKNEKDKYVLLLFDLYWLRYKKPGEQWYELTDYLRDKLNEDGLKIQYTKDNVIAELPWDGHKIDIKKIIKDKRK